MDNLLHNVNSYPDLKSSTKSVYQRAWMANGGAGRDRTDDLKLAKLPLSQLSYGPKCAYRT